MLDTDGADVVDSGHVAQDRCDGEEECDATQQRIRPYPPVFCWVHRLLFNKYLEPFIFKFVRVTMHYLSIHVDIETPKFDRFTRQATTQ